MNPNEILSSIERIYSSKKEDFAKYLDAFMEEFSMAYEYFKKTGNAEVFMGVLSSKEFYNLINMYGKIDECEEVLKTVLYLLEEDSRNKNNYIIDKMEDNESEVVTTRLGDKLEPGKVYKNSDIPNATAFKFIEESEPGIYKFEPMNEETIADCEDIAESEPESWDGKYAYLNSDEVYWTFFDNEE